MPTATAITDIIDSVTPEDRTTRDGCRRIYDAIADYLNAGGQPEEEEVLAIARITGLAFLAADGDHESDAWRAARCYSALKQAMAARRYGWDQMPMSSGSTGQEWFDERD